MIFPLYLSAFVVKCRKIDEIPRVSMAIHYRVLSFGFCSGFACLLSYLSHISSVVLIVDSPVVRYSAFVALLGKSGIEEASDYILSKLLTNNLLTNHVSRNNGSKD
jgi:hypothetical protein